MSIDLFEMAVYHAESRAYWRKAANAARPSPEFSRRKCLVRARRHENHIIDLAIQAERDGPPPRGGPSPDTSPVPKIGAAS